MIIARRLPNGGLECPQVGCGRTRFGVRPDYLWRFEASKRPPRWVRQRPRGQKRVRSDLAKIRAQWGDGRRDPDPEQLGLREDLLVEGIPLVIAETRAFRPILALAMEPIVVECPHCHTALLVETPETRVGNGVE